MNLCAVNGQEFEAPTGLQTWGQLLDTLEQGVGPERAVVTAVRFRGVDQPSFREPDLLSQGLETAAPIDVDTCGAAALVAETVENVLANLAPFVEAMQQAADAFRSHDITDAQGRLIDVVVTLQTLTQLTAAVSQASVTPRTAQSERESATLLAQMGQSLESLVSATENEDWISVADILEYDVADLLPNWAAVLRALATSEQGLAADCRLPGRMAAA
jgi:hypothetical protein